MMLHAIAFVDQHHAECQGSVFTQASNLSVTASPCHLHPKGMETHTQLKLRFAAHLAGEAFDTRLHHGASTHKGMATHTQLKRRFAAHLVGEALEQLLY